MKATSSELKLRARKTLAGRYGLCVGASVLTFAVTIVFMFIYVIGFGFFSIESGWEGLEEGGILLAAGFLVFFIVTYFLSMIIIYFLSVGLQKIIFNLATGQQAGLKDVMFAFTHRPHRFFGLFFINLMVSLVTGIPWIVVYTAAAVTEFMPLMLVLSCLMYVVWIVALLLIFLNWSQATFIMIESGDKKVFQCLRESTRIMKGNKGSLFYIGLSFTGVFLLGYFSFGIGFLWGLPYISCTLIHFYLDRKEAAKPEPVPYDMPYDVTYNEI